MKNFFIGICVIVFLSGCNISNKQPVTANQTEGAMATVKDKNGQDVGIVKFLEIGDNVKVTINLKNLSPGKKAIHIHEVGKCEPPSFESSGGHFNPHKTKHGFLNEHGSHAGDLPNIVVQQDGTALAQFKTNRFNIQSLLDKDGSSVVIHESADDYFTDPAGDSGARIACGVIIK